MKDKNIKVRPLAKSLSAIADAFLISLNKLEINRYEVEHNTEMSTSLLKCYLFLEMLWNDKVLPEQHLQQTSEMMREIRRIIEHGQI